MRRLSYYHQEFDNRVLQGRDFVDDDHANDCHGHGTHVTGTVAGSLYGVTNATLVPVRVLSCTGGGLWSDVLASYDWIVNYMKNSTKRAVINLSLGGGKNVAINQATDRLVTQHNCCGCRSW